MAKEKLDIKDFLLYNNTFLIEEIKRLKKENEKLKQQMHQGVIPKNDLTAKLNSVISNQSGKIRKLTKEKIEYQNKYLGMLPIIERILKEYDTLHTAPGDIV